MKNEQKESEKYRSSVRIYVDILEVIISDESVGPTKILYKSNLSSSRLKKYLLKLIDLGLIECTKNGDKLYYRITEKGIKYLDEFRKFKMFSDAFGISI
ncbi:MAG: winged helix-turn-helix domain-containing protein [Candidatus Thermoplasmatota archaeon]|jgi:predicted transcriptional regulator|nr:winged helix-turn-helix domain-containing protein [Candidatus Thermoplasmatota archaeon]